MWAPVGVVEDQGLAEAMAALLRKDEAAGIEARVISGQDLLHKLRAEDSERILEALSDRTTAAIERGLALRRAAEMWLANTRERRSGVDRRRGGDRRSGQDSGYRTRDRRSGSDRRSGRDRRGLQPTG